MIFFFVSVPSYFVIICCFLLFAFNSKDVNLTSNIKYRNKQKLCTIIYLWVVWFLIFGTERKWSEDQDPRTYVINNQRRANLQNLFGIFCFCGFTIVILSQNKVKHDVLCADLSLILSNTLQSISNKRIYCQYLLCSKKPSLYKIAKWLLIAMQNTCKEFKYFNNNPIWPNLY